MLLNGITCKVMFGCCGPLQQVLDLGPQDVLATDRAMQHRLVDDHPQAGRVRPGEDLLPGHRSATR
jgi:hypothetical protein